MASIRQLASVLCSAFISQLFTLASTSSSVRNTLAVNSTHAASYEPHHLQQVKLESKRKQVTCS